MRWRFKPFGVTIKMRKHQFDCDTMVLFTVPPDNDLDKGIVGAQTMGQFHMIYDAQSRCSWIFAAYLCSVALTIFPQRGWG